MKTDIEKLYQRGYIDSKILSKYIGYTERDLLLLLNSKEAADRSVSIRLLSTKTNSYQKYTDKILELLEKEKALYTKIELTHFLQKGNELTVYKMLPYLGKIGKNQYQSLPDRPSYKMSYPLPRDIIARTLAKMDPCYFPFFLEVLKKGTLIQTREIIDTIGFMAFYYPSLATLESLKLLIACFKNTTDEIIKWKILIALSAFLMEESIYFLETYLKCEKSNIYEQTAIRSLYLIKKRKEKYDRRKKKVSKER